MSEKTNNKFCEYCGNSKKAIGNQRKNGKAFTTNGNGNNDWLNRPYCKKCYKCIQEQKNFIYLGNYGIETDEEQSKRVKNEMNQFRERLERIKNKHIEARKPIDIKLFKIGDNVQFKKLASYKNYHYGTITKINTKTIKIKTEKYECNVSLNNIKKPS